MPQFSVNSTFLYLVTAAVVLFVLAQSGYFLYRAYRRARELNISSSVLKKTIASSALFTIAPAAAILTGVISLSVFLGLPLPWLRLSVLGAITYEMPAATTTALGMGLDLTKPITDVRAFSAIAWVMTLGIIPGVFVILFAMKKIQKGIVSLKAKDEKWGDALLTSLFLGMISAFLGLLFANVRQGLPGFIPLAVAFVSAALMGVCGLLIKKAHMAWLEQYALPISMLGAMAIAIPITAWMR
jgi:hypothetical protein